MNQLHALKRHFGSLNAHGVCLMAYPIRKILSARTKGKYIVAMMLDAGLVVAALSLFVSSVKKHDLVK